MTGKNIQSMQESMLEFIVINFREVFDPPLQGCTSRKQILPPVLFEKIIYKSKEMNWCINSAFIEKLLTFRDVLGWKNIDVVLHHIKSRYIILNCEVLNLMSQVEYPLKKLSIYVQKISDESMESLCAMGSKIECLDLRYDLRYVSDPLKGPFPNLKKLRLTRLESINVVCELYIDLGRFSDTLEELKLENESLDDRLITSIASLKKLKVLSLPFTCVDHFYFYQALSSLKQLRTLDIRYLRAKTRTNFNTSTFLSLMSKLPNLENFDTSGSREEDILKPVECRKLKKFGYHDIHTDDFQPSYDKFKLLADQVFGLFKETYLSTWDMYTYDMQSHHVILGIFKNLSFVPQEQIAIVEKNILHAFEGKLDDKRYQVRKYINTGRCTDDFAMKVINAFIGTHDNDGPLESNILSASKYVSTNILTTAPVARKMLEVMEKDLNKGLCRKLLKMLFNCSYKNLDVYIRTFGLHDVCNKALKNDLIDDEAKMAMKTLLKKINEILFPSSQI